MVFIDGSNLYHGLKQAVGHARIDFRQFCDLLCTPQPPSCPRPLLQHPCEAVRRSSPIRSAAEVPEPTPQDSAFHGSPRTPGGSRARRAVSELLTHLQGSLPDREGCGCPDCIPHALIRVRQPVRYGHLGEQRRRLRSSCRRNPAPAQGRRERGVRQPTTQPPLKPVLDRHTARRCLPECLLSSRTIVLHFPPPTRRPQI